MSRPMKDSGIEWIGEIPEDWGIASLSKIANIQTGSTPDKKYQELYYSDECGIPWIKAEDLGTSLSIDKTTEYLTDSGCKCAKIFPKETVYVCCIASVGKVGFSCIESSCNQQINAIIFNSNYYWKYGFYVSLAQEMEYLINSSGNVMKIINTDKQSRLKCPVPPLSEQLAISAYLDEKCALIDSVIEKTKTTIEEYKKLRQAVITQAVTKGIRDNRPMKDSGSVWFGTIPLDWTVKRIKYQFHIKKDIAGKEGYTVLSITQKGIIPKDLSKNEGQLAESYSNYQIVNIGDFAMNHMDLLTGWVDISKYSGVTSPDYRVFVLDNRENSDSHYFLYMMQMCYSNRIFYGLGQGVSGLGRWRLQADKFLNFLIPIPPLQEQQEIASYLDKKCAEIDTLITKKEQFLKELESYKKSLIYEYVTGKKEVQP